MTQRSPKLPAAWFAAAWLALLPSTAVAQPAHELFRVATFNVRQVNAADTGTYQWSNRSAGVIQSIRDANPDIWGVQEASAAAIRDSLNGAFSGEYDRWQPDGGSPKTIYYRRDRFEPLDPDQRGNHRFENPYATGATCHPNANGRTAAWIKLRDKRTQRVYLVVNTHVAHAAGCHLGRRSAAAELHTLFETHYGEDETLILFGDFNSDAQRPSGHNANDTIIAILEESRAATRLRRSARWTGDTTHALSTYNARWKSSSGTPQRLDYIFVDSRRATTYRQATDQRTINQVLGSGANHSPSDHFLVRAEIRNAPFVHASTQTTLAVGSRRNFAFGDVDADGDADLLAWASDDDTVHVHLALGDGTFEPAPQPSAVSTGEQQLADLDGDGCDDLVTIPSSGPIEVARSRCDGTFDAPQETSLSRGAGEVWRFARFDGDYCRDAVVWRAAGDGRTATARNTCDGSFAFEPLATTSDAGTSTNTGANLAYYDVNGDRLADKLFWDVNQFSGRTQVYLADGAGDFVFHQEQTGGSSGAASTRMFFGDVDGDGAAEKAFWRPTYRQGYIQLYPGGDGLINHPMMVNSGPSTNDSNKYALADVTGDGSADLIRWIPGDDTDVLVFPATIALGAPDLPPVDEPSDDVGQPDAGEPADVGDGSVGDAGNPGAQGDATVEHDAQHNDPTTLEATGGCGCATSDSPGTLWLWSMLALLFARRRRR